MSYLLAGFHRQKITRNYAANKLLVCLQNFRHEKACEYQIGLGRLQQRDILDKGKLLCRHEYASACEGLCSDWQHKGSEDKEKVGLHYEYAHET